MSTGENFKTSEPPPQGDSNVSPSRGSSPLKQEHNKPTSDLAASLGISPWPHTDAALSEALRAKSEQERAKQEYFRLEGNKVVLEILECAKQLGIPGTLVMKLFTEIDEEAKQRVRDFLAAQSRPATLPTVHEQPSQQRLLPSLVQPGTALNSPRTPGKPPVESPGGTTAVQYSTPQRGSHGGTADPDGPTDTPDRFIPGHRATVSAMPTYAPPVFPQPTVPQSQQPFGHPGGMISGGAFYPPQLMATPFASLQQPAVSQPTLVQQPPAIPRPPTVSQPAVPLPSVAPPLTPGGDTGAQPPRLVASQPGSSHHSPVQSNSYVDTPDRGSLGSHQPLVPVMNTISARTIRGRGHQHSLSTGSDLQIHQWKPRHLHRDNRWKYPNPITKLPTEKRSSAGYASGGPSAKQQIRNSSPQHRTPQLQPQSHPQLPSHSRFPSQSQPHLESQPDLRPPAYAGGSRHAANDSVGTDYSFNDSVSSFQSVMARPPSSPNNSAAVAAAGQNNRRRSASRLRRRSAASVDLGNRGEDDLRRRDEGVAALASLAAESPRASGDDSVSGPSPIQPVEPHRSPHAPTQSSPQR